MKSRIADHVQNVDLGEHLGYEAHYKYVSLGKDVVSDDGLTLVLNAGLGAPGFGAPDFNNAHGQPLTFDDIAPQLLNDDVQRVIMVNRPGTGQADLGTLSVSEEKNRSLDVIVRENIAFLRAVNAGRHATLSHSAGAIVGLATGLSLQPGDPELQGMTKVDPVPVNLDVVNTFATKQVLIKFILTSRMFIGGALHGRFPAIAREHPEGLRKFRTLAEAEPNVLPKMPVSLVHAKWTRWHMRHLLCKRFLNLEGIRNEQRKYLQFADEDDQFFTESAAGHNVHYEDPQAVIAAVEHMVKRICAKSSE